MSDLSKPPPMRFTKQLAPDKWITECKVCPKRFSKRMKPTQLAADLWWAEHIETPMHKQSATRDISNGEVLRRPGRMKYRPEDD